MDPLWAQRLIGVEARNAQNCAAGSFLRTTETELLIANEESNDLKGLAWSPDSRWLAFMYHHDSGSYIVVVDAQTGKLTQSIPVNEYYHYMQFTADGGHLLVSAWDLPETKIQVRP
jgi:hypothetical protein